MSADDTEQRPISILYVDDEPGLLEIGKIYLERMERVIVDTCESVDEALNKLQDAPFDVIISDYQMPGKDGIEFLKILRGLGDSIPFIIFTGKGRQEVVIEALNNGADFYVQKGGDPKSQFAELSNKVIYAFSRKNAESALFEQNKMLLDSKQELNTIINRLTMAQSIGHSGSWEFKIDDSSIWGSAEGWRIFGLPPESGYRNIEFVESCIPDRERVHQALLDLVQFDKEYNLTYVVHPVDGSSPRTVNSIAHLERDDNRNILRVVGVIRDITKEMAIERLSRIQGNAMDVAVDGIAILDAEGLFVYSNPSLTRIYGISSRDFMNNHYSKLLHPDCLQDTLDEINKAMANSNSYRGTSRGIRKNGSAFPQDMSLTAIEEGGYILVVRDISKLKTIERELLRKTTELQTINGIINAVNKAEDLQELLKTIFDISLDLFGYEKGGIYLLDKGGGTATLAHHNLDEHEILANVQSVPVDDPPFCTVLKEKKPIFTTEYDKLQPGFPFRYVVSIPLTSSGLIVGSLNMASHERHLLDRTEKEALSSICNELGTAIHRMLLMEETRRAVDNLEYLFDHIEELAFIADTDGKIIGVNKMALKRLSYDMESIIGKSIEVLHPVHMIEESREIFRKIKDEGLKVFRLPLIGKDGTIIEAEIMTILGTWNGQKAIIGLARDITEHLAIEKKLKERDEFNTSILENIPEYILIYRDDGNIIYINKYAAKEFKYTPEEMLGKPLIDFVPEEMRDMLAHKVQERTAGKELAPYEAALRDSHGNRVPVLIKGSRILHQGEMVNLIVMVDISDRKKIEEELRSNEEHYRNLYEETPLGYQSLDEDGCFKEVNDAWLRIMGYERDEVIGRSFGEFITPEYRELFKENFPLFKQIGETSVEFQMVKKDGKSIFVKFDGRIGHDHYGHFRQTHCIMDDITERKRYEEALCRTNKKLQLLSSITRHDIINQISVLEGFAFLLHDDHGPAEKEKMLNCIESASRKIRAQIEFTSLYDKLGADAPVWHSISGLLSGIDHRGLIDHRCDGLEVFADPMISKVFDNLLDNSLRHGLDVSLVEIAYRVEGERCILSYTDDGGGVPLEYKEAIFQRGYGTNTGLGLFLIREILDITGITIIEKGTPGEGVRFEICIPAGAWRRQSDTSD